MSGVPESGVPPSLKFDGTGGTGWWYFGPTIKPARENMAKTAAARVHILVSFLFVGSRLHRNAHSAGERIGRIGDYGIRLTYPTHNFDCVAEIMAKRDFS